MSRFGIAALTEFHINYKASQDDDIFGGGGKGGGEGGLGWV